MPMYRHMHALILHICAYMYVYTHAPMKHIYAVNLGVLKHLFTKYKTPQTTKQNNF